MVGNKDWEIQQLADWVDDPAIAHLAMKILQDPLQMQRLSDRVYQLWQQDLRIQQERNCGYGRRF